MRIDKLIVENFKSFVKEEFNLNPSFTVFIGDNATGKTSVLNALSVSLGSFLLGIEGVASRPINPQEVRVKTINGQPKPQKPSKIRAHWNLTDEDRSVWEYKESEKNVVWSRAIEKIQTNSKYARPVSILAARLLKKSRTESGVIFPLLAYYGTGRLWASHEKLSYQKQEEGVKMAYTNALSAKASPKEFLEWFKTQENSITKFQRPLEISHFNAMKTAIMSLIPEGRWQEMAFDHKANDLTGRFKNDDGEWETLNFSQLSDGFRCMIAMAGDMIFRGIQLNPHLGELVVHDTPGVVLVDELDMHLHPNWQRRVVADLKRVFPKIQFVATTHSPFVVQSLKGDEVWNLDRTMEGNPSELKIDIVAEEIMGVPSAFSMVNTEVHHQTRTIMERIQSGEPGEDLDKEIANINDPGLRAFLELQLLAAGK